MLMLQIAGGLFLFVFGCSGIMAIAEGIANADEWLRDLDARDAQKRSETK